MEVKMFNTPTGFDAKQISKALAGMRNALRWLARTTIISGDCQEVAHLPSVDTKHVRLNPTFTWVERHYHKHRKTELFRAVRSGSEYVSEYQFYRDNPSFTCQAHFSAFEQALVDHYQRLMVTGKNDDDTFDWVGSVGGCPILILNKKSPRFEDFYRTAAILDVRKTRKLKFLQNMRTVSVWQSRAFNTTVDLNCTPLQAIVFKHILGGINDTH